MKSEGEALVLLLLLASVGLARKKYAGWTDDDMRAFLDAIKRTGVPAEAALLVYYLESGLQPWQVNAHGSYGINQAQRALLDASGWKGSTWGYLNLSVREQLPYVAKILSLQVRDIGYAPSDAAELMRAQLSLKAAKEKNDTIYSAPSAGYQANRWMDKTQKGSITMDDLRASLDQVAKQPLYQRHLSQLRRLHVS